MLHSCGYQNAQSLSVKLVTLFRLSAQYLSLKSYYDFGMRPIKAILCVAKTAKANREVVDEEATIANAICEYISCELNDFDSGVFQSIFNDIFPGKWTTHSSSDRLVCAVKDVCAANNIDCTEYFLLKIQQLYRLLHITAGIILIGDAYSGKTTLYRTLANALTLCGERNELNEMRPECKGTQAKFE